MNPETTFLIERPYQDVVDDVLTALVGGVVNEPIVFDVKADLYRLSKPARDVRGITGFVPEDEDERLHTFLKGIDFEFSEGDNAVVWTDGGDKPERRDDLLRRLLPDATAPRPFRTSTSAAWPARSARPSGARSPRSTSRSTRPTARLSSTRPGASRSTSWSPILGLTRKGADFATGLATFFRDPAVAGAIAIPQGVALSTAKGEAFFETTEPRVLQAGQPRIDAPIRAAVGFGGDVGIVPSGAITTMVQPLAGILRVTNFEATTRAAAHETDEELRARAKAALRSLGKATIAALDRVIREGRAIAARVLGPQQPARPSGRTPAPWRC